MHLIDITPEEATDALVQLAQHAGGSNADIGQPILASKRDGEVIIATDDAWWFPQRDHVARVVELTESNELTAWIHGEEIKRVFEMRGSDTPTE